MVNPLLGVVFHWIGGLASASFYVPYRGVRSWSWEVFWLTGGVFSWIVAPWLFASLQTQDLLGVLGGASPSTWFWCVFFGILWGFGGLTFGLTLRFLGISLGTAVALGLTAAFGTLIPPLVSGEFFTSLLPSTGGQIVLAGVFIALAGIAIVGMAGHAKERHQAAGDAPGSRPRDFRRGMAVAVFSGIMSSCFAYGLAAGEPIRQATLAAGTDPLSQGLPVLCIVLLGGFATNALWCGYLIARNRSAGQFVGGAAHDDGKVAEYQTMNSTSRPRKSPLARNYLLSALGGTIWYFQFFFYTMGESQMGAYGFSSWTLHMASIIIFATLWGLALKEWRGAGRRARTLLSTGLAVLIGSTAVIGWGNALSAGSL
ncbi:L-rhamnose/proton symporter RhaT [Pacificimonas flava]|uniref:L-rhamnose-proton symporter n=1 Tax=Pacificimonas flava TaxID=1234595 RepID=M2U8X3_9SPHN|nr:L-rhamnose/proton symporter RhaT [Pacificimonas flava]EMD84397.1 L-rhamnose-proton symporter [Pacificimonas flava]MBB5279731.1 L-rhamnose-H+ transport protein [Pacificimonas flava]